MKHCGIIILAAGSSSRLGRPKQLVEFNGETLLTKALYAAIDSYSKPVIIVLGSSAEGIEQTLGSVNVDLVLNTDWEEGIASSIRAGIARLKQTRPDIQACILMVCDQPYTNADILKQLYSVWLDSDKEIVASSYAGTIGTPVLFSRTMFHFLQSLEGDSGAKSIIQQHPEKIITIDFPQGAIDIDNETDLEHLKTDS